MLDPSTGDETVDGLRRAATGIVEARNHAQLATAGEELATAALRVGVDRWPGFIGDAERRGIAAVDDRLVPGVVKADFATSQPSLIATGIGLGLVVLLFQYLTNQAPDLSRPTIAPAKPTDSSQGPTDKQVGKGSDTSSQGVPSPDPAGVVVSDRRRKHILDGESNGSGGHGPGRNRSGKSEFPQGWSDDRVIETIKEVANDPSSNRKSDKGGRITVEGTREGIDVKVILENDNRTVVTAYPTNVPRNP